VVDISLILKLKDFFQRNFGVQPKMRLNSSQILIAATVEIEHWVSVWSDGGENFCLMGNGQIRVHELMNLTNDLMKSLSLTESSIGGHCSHDLWAVPMAKERVASINQVEVCRIKQESENLIGGAYDR